MTPQLRPYQRASIDALYDYFSANTGNPLIVIPTGGGKSICFCEAHIENAAGQRVASAMGAFKYVDPR